MDNNQNKEWFEEESNASTETTESASAEGAQTGGSDSGFEFSAPASSAPAKTSFFAGISKIFTPAFIKVAAAVVVALAVVGTGVGALAANFVFFPSIDSAIEKAIEPKLDLGTKFDFADLAKEGKISIVADNIKDEIAAIDRAEVALSYTDKGAALFAALDEDEFNLILNEKGIAVNAEKFNDGDYYGVKFDDFIEELEDSVFGPGNSDYSIPEETFEAIEDAWDEMQDLEKTSKDLEDDVKVVMNEVVKVWKKSDISDCKTDLFSVSVLGDSRFARNKTYEIDKDDVVEFLENLAEKFDDPSNKFDKAVDNLFESLESATGKMDAGDIADALEMLADQLDASNQEFELVLTTAFSGTALSAVIVEYETEDKDNGTSTEGRLTVDFGKSGSKSLIVENEIVIKRTDGQEHNVSRFEYNVESKGGETAVTLAFITESEEESADALGELMGGATRTEKTSYVEATLELNRNNNEATLEITSEGEENGTKKEKETLLSVSCDYVDKSSELSLTLDTLIFDGNDLMENIPADITVTVYKSADSVKLPKHENLFEMDNDDFEDLYTELEEHFTEKIEEWDINLGASDDEAPENGVYGEFVSSDGNTMYEFDGYNYVMYNGDISYWYEVESGTYVVNEESGQIEFTFSQDGSNYQRFSSFYTDYNGNIVLDGITYYSEANLSSNSISEGAYTSAYGNKEYYLYTSDGYTGDYDFHYINDDGSNTAVDYGTFEINGEYITFYSSSTSNTTAYGFSVNDDGSINIDGVRYIKTGN